MAIKRLQDVQNPRLWRMKDLPPIGHSGLNGDQWVYSPEGNAERLGPQAGDVAGSPGLDINFYLENRFKDVPMEYFEAGILQIVGDKIVPGPNAHKRMKRTKYGFETEAEITERRIKKSLWDQLNANRTPNLPTFENFRHMSFDEIDSKFDPTARNYIAFVEHSPKQRKAEIIYDRRRRRWVKYARKHGTWWVDSAKKQVEDAKKRSFVPFDENSTALYMKAFGNHDPRTYTRVNTKEDQYYQGTDNLNHSNTSNKRKKKTNIKRHHKKMPKMPKQKKGLISWLLSDISEKTDARRVRKIREKALRDHGEQAVRNTEKHKKRVLETKRRKQVDQRGIYD